MNGKIMYFILLMTFIFINFIWTNCALSYMCIFDEYLDNKFRANRELYSRTNILLSEIEKEENNVRLKGMLIRNQHRNIENEGDNVESGNDGKVEHKDKDRSRTVAKNLVMKCESFMCKTFYVIGNLFEKILHIEHNLIDKCMKFSDSALKKRLNFSSCISTALAFILPGVVFLTAIILSILAIYYYDSISSMQIGGLLFIYLLVLLMVHVYLYYR
ncbi:Plasmodium exported protein, unknown function [Plasmodium malariae]|uniref:Uncharacterized protein n=1 Tax=Plasmodium malariae TaxID=5858 RepID=A0A1D3RJD3_PLAMA|nr:Plasmodium exported protein, unknown function [Plasmodium malariae]SCN45291.1 Plasmodium exported protein, unknown function [Plasmodium malariae]